MTTDAKSRLQAGGRVRSWAKAPRTAAVSATVSAALRAGLPALAVALVSACSSSSGVGIKPAPDPTPTPSPSPDAGVMAPPPAAGPPGMMCPCTFTEDFKTPSRIDSGETTVTLNQNNLGGAYAPAPFTLESPGAGGSPLSVTTSQTLPGGEQAYSSLTVTGGTLQFTGDTTLTVSGAVSLSQQANVTGTGKLTIIAGGDVRVDCSQLVSGGDLVIHQSQGNVEFTCAQAGQSTKVLTSLQTTGNSGSITVWTRGSVSLTGSSQLYTGNVEDAAGRSGAIEIRAYGDVRLGPAPGPGAGVVITGGSVGQNGDLSIYTEGQVVLDGLRIAGGDSTSAAAAGGTVRVHARGAVTLQNGGNIFTSPAGSLDLVSEGAVTLQNSGYILTPKDGNQTSGVSVHIRALSLTVGSASYSGDNSSVVLQPGLTQAGNLIVEAVRDVQLNEKATVGVAPAPCLKGGNVIVSTEHGLVVGAQAQLRAGDSISGTSCPAAQGGSLLVNAGSALPSMAGARAGLGSPAGQLSLNGSQSVKLGVLEAGLAPAVQASSVGLPILGTQRMPRVTAATLGTSTPASYPGLYLELKAGSGDFQPVRYMPLSIQDGWRYQLLLEPRMFDGVSLASFTLTYQ